MYGENGGVSLLDDDSDSEMSPLLQFPPNDQDGIPQGGAGSSSDGNQNNNHGQNNHGILSSGENGAPHASGSAHFASTSASAASGSSGTSGSSASTSSTTHGILTNQMSIDNIMNGSTNHSASNNNGNQGNRGNHGNHDAAAESTNQREDNKTSDMSSEFPGLGSAATDIINAATMAVARRMNELSKRDLNLLRFSRAGLYDFPSQVPPVHSSMLVAQPKQ